MILPATALLDGFHQLAAVANPGAADSHPVRSTRSSSWRGEFYY